MVYRNKLYVDDILYSEGLNCYPAENQASKIFIKWLKEHPEYNADDVDLKIDSYEQEEDYYGNGGGCEQYARIYKRREETNEEYKSRIMAEEDIVFEEFNGKLYKCLHDLIRELSIYPYVYGDDITKKIEQITAAMNTDIKNILGEQLQKVRNV